MTLSPRYLLPLALAAFGLQAGGAIPPPEKLLPKDTVLVGTAPDWQKAAHFWSNAPYAKLWQDPALKPFKDKFFDKFDTGVIKPLEQTLGIKFSDYAGLVQGQVTYALLPIISKDNPDKRMSVILLIDTKDHAGQLKSNLADVIKKWADAGKPMKGQKIRGADFTTLMVSPGDFNLKKIFPNLTPADPARHGASVCVPSPRAQAIVDGLAQRGVLAWNGVGRVRFSFHGYNSLQDVDRAVDALRAEWK